MTVAGRIATGTGVALALLVMILVWDVTLVDRLAGVNKSLSEIDYRASMLVLEQARKVNKIDEFTRKYHVTLDPAYADRLSLMQREFAEHLGELRSLDLSPRLRQEVVELAMRWEQYWRLCVTPVDSGDASATAPDVLLDLQLERLFAVQAQLARVSESAQNGVLEQSLLSAEISGRAQTLSWSIAASTLLLCLLILWWTIRSIQRPLTQLARGTQAVAEGEFSVQVDERGSDELSRLATSFNQMVQRLSEAERAKKDFLSHVSHELKTPLASMYETNELLLEEIPGELNEAQKRFLRLNLDSSRRLSAMISKLLDLSRLEAGVMQYEFRHHDLADLVRSAIAGFEARARELEVGLKFPMPSAPVVVDCDFDRMIQVVQNLVDNALRFSPRGGSIELRVIPPGPNQILPAWYDQTESSMRQLSEDMLLLEVVDSGPGISDDQKPLVFRRFHQIRSSGSGHPTGGVGLGLTICGEIISAHQGWMGLRDNPGGGSIFVVALPVAAGQPEAGDSHLDGLEARAIGT